MRLRPHHGFCVQNFAGKGYSGVFTANLAEILHALEASPEQEIELVSVPDSICAPCPHLTGAGCEKELTVSAIDRRCLAACGLAEGTRLSWLVYRTKARAVLKNAGPEKLCGDCQWLTVCTPHWQR